MKSTARTRFRTAASLLCAALCVLCLPLAAAPAEGTAGQTVTGRSLHRHDAPVRNAVAAPGSPSKPAWKDLTPAQQQALQPLASHWDRLGEVRKRKWLVISKNFQTLPAEEQAKIHRRMSKWATLTQQERIEARQNFKEIKVLTPEQKAVQWEAYQALSADEKRKLAAQARRTAGVATVKPSAAARLIPVASRKKHASGARMAEAVRPIQQNTLLPRVEPVRTEPQRSPYEDEPAE
jgi:hypothetical protein